ncbi:MAG: hypothetical protein ACT4O9_01405 [Blastocatellia bacterium]
MRTLFFTTLFLLGLGIFSHAAAQKPGDVKIGISREKPVVKNRLKLRFLEVMEDSRCPIGTDCVWAGNAKVKIQIRKPGGVPKIFELNTAMGDQFVLVEGYKIQLASLTPHPRADAELKKETYTAIFNVTKRVK